MHQLTMRELMPWQEIIIDDVKKNKGKIFPVGHLGNWADCFRLSILGNVAIWYDDENASTKVAIYDLSEAKKGNAVEITEKKAA